MKLEITFPDKVATPRKVRAIWSFDADLESTEQPVRINWGDQGSAVEAVASGDLTQDHDYAVDGFYRVTVHSNDNRVSQRVTVGAPGMPAHGATELRKLRDRREDAAVIAGTTGRVG
jgi:hypothetical protein